MSHDSANKHQHINKCGKNNERKRTKKYSIFVKLVFSKLHLYISRMAIELY